MSVEPSLVRQSTAVLSIYTLNALINAAGILMNIGLILITIKNRQLHSTCFLLIGSSGFCTILMLTGIFIPLAVILLPEPIGSMPMLQCFLAQCLPIYCTFNAISLMAVIGLDRLLSVFFSLWYMQRNERSGLISLLAISAIFPLAILWLIFGNVSQQPEKAVVCTLGELLGDRTSPVAGLSLLANCLSVLFYAIVWAKLKWDVRRGASQETISSRQPIFKSLSIILAIQVGGWCITEVAFTIVFLQGMASLQQWTLAACINLFGCVAASADPIVLFCTSEQYRKAFCKQFPWLTQVWHKVDSSSTIVLQNSTNHQRVAWATSRRNSARRSMSVSANANANAKADT